MESLAELRAREEEVGREWQWLDDALNTVARVTRSRASLIACTTGCPWEAWPTSSAART